MVGVMMYNPLKDAWQKIDTVLPKARVGSCAVVLQGDRILLIGGKDHLEDNIGSDEIWEFDSERREFDSNATWPLMKRQRYYHGCTIGVLNGEKGKFSKHYMIQILLYGCKSMIINIQY